MDDEGEHQLDTVEEPRMKSHQPQSMGIANIGSPYEVKVLMDDGRVLAEVMEQTGEKTLNRPPSEANIIGVYLWTRCCM